MIRLDTSYLKEFISTSDISSFKEKLRFAHSKLHDENDLQNGKGWLYLPNNFQQEKILEIENLASEIRNNCDTFVVIGIGGSYLGAKAAIEFLKPKY